MPNHTRIAGANDVTSLIAAIVEENENRFIEKENGRLKEKLTENGLFLVRTLATSRGWQLMPRAR
jgi:hypothetical protein